MASERLDILINAKNNSSSAFQQVRNELKGLDSAAATAAKGIGGLATAAGVAGVVALTGLAAEAARTALAFNSLEASFQTLASQAGGSGDAMLAALRKASQGMIADADLIQAANRAMLLGVADTAEEMATLMQIAAERGQAMGLSMTQAFDNIVTGLGRGSALILDNLGILIDAEEANRAYAQSVGKTAAALSDAEKKQALINAVLAQGGTGAQIAVDPFQQLGAAMENFKVATGQLLVEGTPLIAFLSNAAEAVNSLNEALGTTATEQAQANLMQLEPILADLAEQVIDAQSRIAVTKLINPSATAEAERALHQLQVEIEVLGEQYNKAAAIAGAPMIDIDALKAGTVQFDMMATAIRNAGNAAAEATTQMQSLDIAALAASEHFGALVEMTTRYRTAVTQAGSRLVDEMGPQGALGWIQQQTEAVKAQVDAWEAQGFTTREIADVLLPNYLANLQDITAELDTSSHRTAGLSKEAREAERAFEDLRNKVQGVLSGALDPGVGVNPDEILESLGLRPDAINEDARRLADVAVKGFESPWVDYFRDKFPALWAQFFSGAAGDEGLKAQAAQLLKNFQDGLVPELIDKDRAKAMVKRLILGEQNLGALAQEIAQEIAEEMGLPVQEALAKAQEALGVGGGSGSATGAGFGDAALSQIQSANTGGAMADALISQIKATFSRIEQAGRDAGSVWGSGFLSTVSENIPPQLVDMLVNLVTPGVAAGIARNQTLQGAQ